MRDFGVKEGMFVPSYVVDEVIDIDALTPAQVSVEDIADTLSKGCRYAGRCPYPYSVAQHAVFTAWLLEGTGLEYEGLHHDDTEAYIGDIMGPFKSQLRVTRPEEWLEELRVSEFEAKIRRQAIAPALGLLPEEPAAVKQADLWALRLEQRYLQGRLDVEAPLNGLSVTQIKYHLRPLHWRRARDLYMEKHWELKP